MNSVRSFIRHILLEEDDKINVKGGIATSLEQADEKQVDDPTAVDAIQKSNTALFEMRSVIINDVNSVLVTEGQVGRYVSNEDEIERARGTEFLLRKDIVDIQEGKFAYPYRTALYVIGHFNGELSIDDDLKKISDSANSAVEEVKKVKIPKVKRGRTPDDSQLIPAETPQNERRDRRYSSLLMEEPIGIGLAILNGIKFFAAPVAADVAAEMGGRGAAKAASKAATALAGDAESALLTRIVRNGVKKMLEDPASFNALIDDLINGGNLKRGIVSAEDFQSAAPDFLKPASKAFADSINQWWSTVNVEKLKALKVSLERYLANIKQKSAGTSFEKLDFDKAIEIIRVVLVDITANPSEKATADVILNRFMTLDTLLSNHPDPDIVAIAKDIELLMTSYVERTRSTSGVLPRDIKNLPDGPLKELLSSQTSTQTLIATMKSMAEFGEECAKMMPTQLPIKTAARIGGRAVASGVLAGLTAAGSAVALVITYLVSRNLMSTYEATFVGFDYIPEDVTNEELKSILTDVKIRAAASEHMQSAIAHPPVNISPVFGETIDTGDADDKLLSLLKQPAGFDVELSDIENCRAAYESALNEINQETQQ